MPSKVALSTLNATTMDIMNVIRQNAPFEYQSLVPEVQVETDIPKVGQVILGTPALSNHFVSALINRIAQVRIKSATFNNDYAEFKKGYLEYGETVEEVFVQIAKAREFSVEKAEKREFKRTIPDVRAAFHVMNWRVQYPVTVQYEDLRMAFLSASGVQDLVAKIIDSLYNGDKYDEYLLFKYLIIMGYNKNVIKKQYMDGAIDDYAAYFRCISNLITFFKTEYNAEGVTTSTPKNDQYIFMDSMFNAQFDVNVLARAFNMEKADFMGRLKLVDDWTTFDNERFEEIRAESNGLEEVTAEELENMANVKAVLFDKEWFQFYDNLMTMTEKQVAAGIYWNYFLNVWRTVSYSPFSNAVAFVAGEESEEVVPDYVMITDAYADAENGGFTYALKAYDSNDNVIEGARFLQTESATENAVAITPYGMVIANANNSVTFPAEITITVEYNGVEYNGTFTVGDTTNIPGTTISVGGGGD